MKILIIHNYYLEKGGEDEVVSAEVRLLEEHGHKVILYDKSNRDIEKFSFFKKLIFIFQELNFSKIVYKEVKEIIRLEKPDIAHIHNIFIRITPSIYFALKEEKVPIVQSLHNYRFFCLSGTFYRKGAICEKCKNNKFFNAVLGKCWRNSFVLSFLLVNLLSKANIFLKKIDAYIVLSKFSRDKFIELGLEREKIYLKTNFLQIESGMDGKDCNYALFIGRLVDYKGIITLIKAFKILSGFKLKIIGDGPLRREVHKISSACDNIEWLGKLDKVPVFEALKNASFLIFPSEWYEHMPMVMLESFLSSKPILASNLGAMKEFVIDGVNGILFEPGNVADLAAKISYLFSHDQERTEMGRNANKIYQERFNKENNYLDLISIYNKTINSMKS